MATKRRRLIPVLALLVGLVGVVGFCVTLVAGFAADSGALLADSMVFLLVAFMGVVGWAWFIAVERQRSAARIELSEDRFDTLVASHVPADRSLRRSNELRRAARRRQGIGAAGFGVLCLLLLIGVLVGLNPSGVAVWVWVPNCLLFVGGVFWLTLWHTLYVKPFDIAAIAAEDTNSRVWVSATSAGLKAYSAQILSRSAAKRRSLKFNGYLAVTKSELQFWQRSRAVLTFTFRIPRSEIAAVAPADVTWAFVVQKGVLLSLSLPADRQVDVPVLPSNSTFRRYGKASAEVVRILGFPTKDGHSTATSGL